MPISKHGGEQSSHMTPLSKHDRHLLVVLWIMITMLKVA